MVRARIVAGVVVVTVDGPGAHDLEVVQQLAALALCARRHGLVMRVTPVTPALRGLLELCGLAGLVLATRGVEEPG